MSPTDQEADSEWLAANSYISVDGTGFLINQKYTKTIVSVKSIANRVAYTIRYFE